MTSPWSTPGRWIRSAGLGVALAAGGCSPDSSPLPVGPPDTGALAVSAHLDLQPQAMVFGALTASVLVVREESTWSRELPVAGGTASCLIERLEPGQYVVEVRIRDERGVLGRGSSTAIVYAGGTTDASLDLDDRTRAVGSSWSRTAAPKMLSPEPLEILDNACGDPRFTEKREWEFSWSEVPFATRYHLRIRHPEIGVHFEKWNIFDTTYRYDTRDPVTRSDGWRWLVRAQVRGQWGPWSEQREFRVEPAGLDCPDLDCYPDLPDPEVAFGGTEDYEANGREWTRYRIPVVNRTAFPREMFDPAPYLPSCGINENASRTWVDILGPNGRIYGFCALGEPGDLMHIWFAEPRGDPPPAWVRVRLHDRACDLYYLSQELPLDPGPAQGAGGLVTNASRS